MTVASCRDCGEKVSRDARQCPRCGCPWPATTEREIKRNKTLWLAVFVVPLLLLLLLILFGPKSPPL